MVMTVAVRVNYDFTRDPWGLEFPHTEFWLLDASEEECVHVPLEL